MKRKPPKERSEIARALSDSRYRQRVVVSKKVYSRKARPKVGPSDFWRVVERPERIELPTDRVETCRSTAELRAHGGIFSTPYTKKIVRLTHF
jgi:hypothetical protein